MKSSSSSSKPNYAGAIKYAIECLLAELPEKFHYHNVNHTRDDVLPAVTRLAKLKGLSDDDRHLLEVAAAYHDVGLIKVIEGHEKQGVKIISEILPRYDFGPNEIQRITDIILATRLPQSPQNEEQELMVDADLDSLGRDDYFTTSKALWNERKACGIEILWEDWLKLQLDFLLKHEYFSDEAKDLRNKTKQKNIELLQNLINEK